VLVPADGAPPSRESALIALGTPDRSALFRIMGDGAATRVECRPMNCRFDPRLDVPADAYRALSGLR
jgi:glutamine synthetase